tara:strand:- start:154 stop:450 length:297 start_codon:yes stop_codon:yes gene_type:complete
MPHTRDLKIAKLLHHTISEFFVKHASDLDLFIDSVEMSDRRNADIMYRLGFNTTLSEQSIRELHEQITARKPQLKKYLAEQMQLKSIPKLHFHVTIHE